MQWKRMMLSVLPVAGLALAPSPASAETYVRLGVTPSMGAALVGSLSDAVVTNDTTTSETVGVSLGKGIGLDAAIGTELAPHFAVELGLGYLFGLKTTSTQTANFGAGGTALATQDVTGGLLRITPAVVLSADVGTVSAYSRFGLVIGIASATVHQTNSKTTDKTVVSEDEEQFSGGVGVGVLGALGAEIPLSGKLSLFGEINSTALSWSPAHSEITVKMDDGNDKLPDMTVRAKQTDYVSPQTQSSSDKPDDSKPAEKQALYLPFSSLGLQIGVRLGF